MSGDLRRLVIPESIADDPRAYELLSGWATGTGQVSVMTRTDTGLDQNPAIWGVILAAVAGDVALLVQVMTGAGPSATMAAIKQSLDRAWSAWLADLIPIRAGPFNPREIKEHSMSMRAHGLANFLATACGLGGGGVGNVKKYERVPELVAAEDIPAGSAIKQETVRIGKLYYKKGQRPAASPRAEEAPPDLFPGDTIGILGGKRLGRALKQGEAVKVGDITEPDGSPSRKPAAP